MIGGTITETAVTGLTLEEREQLQALLEKVKGNLAETNRPPPPARSETAHDSRVDGRDISAHNETGSPHDLDA